MGNATSSAELVADKCDNYDPLVYDEGYSESIESNYTNEYMIDTGRDDGDSAGRIHTNFYTNYLLFYTNIFAFFRPIFSTPETWLFYINIFTFLHEIFTFYTKQHFYKQKWCKKQKLM